jgi:glycosyltransferase involved in cell wall biosynthesis
MMRNLRVAWIGAEPEPGGAVAGCAWLLVNGLANLGCRVDCYVSCDQEHILPELVALPGVSVINVDTGWRYDRWYSNHRASKILTGLAARAWGRRRLAMLLLERHRHLPYDVIYQFSTIEVFGFRGHLEELPPLVIHPETHMAGELRWVRRERHLSARCEARWRRLLTEALLSLRARRQYRDIQLAEQVIAISRRFAEHLMLDFGLSPDRVSLVSNPIDLDELRPAGRSERNGPRRVAFISRMSARKGVEQVVELSHRLADLEGVVTLELVGACTLWSDYRPLLADLNTQVAHYHGQMDRTKLIQFLGEMDILIQPAQFEPFGLTVGEALALGVPIVASDEVGAAEDVATECCIIVPHGDIDALESAVRTMLGRIDAGEGPDMNRRARAEAERLFAPRSVARAALDALRIAADRPRETMSPMSENKEDFI